MPGRAPLVAVVGLAVAACSLVRPTAVLPPNAPLSLAECGWSAGTPLAFAGWATLAELGRSAGLHGGDERVFAIVSRDRIELHPMIGPSRMARGYCARGLDGQLEQSGVPDDWRPPR